MPAALSLGAHRHRHHRLQHEPLGVVALTAQVAAEREADGREHDVVERAAERVLDRFELRQIRVEERVAAVRPDVDVERARRRRRVDPRERRRADAGETVLAPARRLARARAAARGRRAPSQLAPSSARRAPRRAASPAPAAAARSRASEARSAAGSRGGVEQHRRDVHAGDAVDERVVGLGDQREAPAGHALHEPDLPQRLGAVQALGEEAPGEPLERRVVGRLRQRGVADVVVGVEVRVVGPHGAALAERHEREALAIARHEVQAR